MTELHSRKELHRVLVSEYQKLRLEVGSIPPSHAHYKIFAGNRSLCDLIAIQAGWGKLLIAWYETGKRGMIPPMPCLEYRWSDRAKLERSFCSRHQRTSVATLLKKLESVVEQLTSIIEENSEVQLFTTDVYNWTGEKWPLFKWMLVYSSMLWYDARRSIRKWKKENGMKHRQSL